MKSEPKELMKLKKPGKSRVQGFGAEFNIKVKGCVN